MIQPNFELIGRGVYTVAEAHRLTDVPSSRIRRWTRGYSYRYKGDRRHTPPVILPQVDLDGVPVLGFTDLIEVRFLDAFRRVGVSWKTIHIASQRAKDLLGQDHPFSSRRFMTDGRTILAEIAYGPEGPVLLDLIRGQYELERIIGPHLYSGLDYNGAAEPERWWPMGKDRRIVVDPERSFGAPIVAEEGVPTHILAAAYRAEGSYDFVAGWYDVSPAAVRDAVDFESKTAA